ncbi:Endoglucanase 15 [Zea mays]|uniref:Endoglucanase 15 n=1 Tax=Zea mays TaxID=4577 RepID=A0A1D6HM38_MAIZE|nr:Endoglucanase 15 [Zea mays]
MRAPRHGSMRAHVALAFAALVLAGDALQPALAGGCGFDYKDALSRWTTCWAPTRGTAPTSWASAPTRPRSRTTAAHPPPCCPPARTSTAASASGTGWRPTSPTQTSSPAPSSAGPTRTTASWTSAATPPTPSPAPTSTRSPSEACSSSPRSDLSPCVRVCPAVSFLP